jgi:hypothetical protein
MFVDDVSTSSKHRLNQILHTLKHVHSFDLKLDESSVDEITTIHNASEILKSTIVQEGVFNNWHSNPDYAKHMLIVEATRLYLKEIAPRRRPRNLHEGRDTPGHSKAADVGYWLMNFAETAETDDDKLLKMLNSFSRVGNELTRVGDDGSYNTLKDLIEYYETRANDSMNDEVDRSHAKTDLHALRVGLKLYKKHNTDDKLDIAASDEMSESDDTALDIDSEFAQRFPELAELAKKYGIGDSGTTDTGAIIADEGNEFSGALAAARSAHKDKFTVGKKQYTVKESATKSRAAGKRIAESSHMQNHDYQASMARSELYRNAKYAMDMLKMIRPDEDIEPWIASALTTDAMYLDKIYHYLDYYTKFEPDQLPGRSEQPDFSELDEDDAEMEEATGSMARANLVEIFEYSVKLFHMIQPGDKLEGWVAMKLTTASEGISSAKHYLDYKNFERHASEQFNLAESGKHRLREASVGKDLKLVTNLIKRQSDAGARHHMAKHHADVFAKKDPKFNRSKFFAEANAKEQLPALSRTTRRSAVKEAIDNAEQDLQQAETLIAAKSISDDLQAMAEKVARMGVDELMPLVDTMKSQFGPEVADAYNTVMKAQLDTLLTATQEAKDQSDNAVISLQNGSMPGGGATDIENLPAEGLPGEEPELAAPGEEETDGLGTTPSAAGGEEPLGRAKKPGAELAESRRRRLGEKWDTEMKTAEKDKGKWDGWTLAKLRSRRKTLMDKATRTAAEQKEVKQIDFAIRAKQKDKFGDVKKESVSEAKQLNPAAALAREIINSIVNDYKNQGFNWGFADVGEFGDFLADEYDRTTRDADGDNSYQDRFFELSDSDMNKVMNAVRRNVNKVFNNQSDLDDRGLGRNSFRPTSESIREAVSFKDVMNNPKLAKGTEHQDLVDLMYSMGVIEKPPLTGKTSASDEQRRKNKPADKLSVRNPGDVVKYGDEYKYMRKGKSPDAQRMKAAYSAGGPKGVLPENAKPDFLDVDKDGDKKEPMKKAVADKAKAPVKKVAEAKKAKPDFLDVDKDGDKKEPMKKAVADKAKAPVKKKVAEAISPSGHAHLGDVILDLFGKIYDYGDTGLDYLDSHAPTYDNLLNHYEDLEELVKHESSDVLVKLRMELKSVLDDLNDEHTETSDNITDIAPYETELDILEATKTKSPYAIGMWKAKKEAGMNPNKPAKDLPKKVITRGHKIARGIDKTDESVARLGGLLETARKGKLQLESLLATHRAEFAKLVNEGRTKDVLLQGQGLEGDILQNRINEMTSMVVKLEDQITALNANSRRQMKEAIAQERKAYRFAQAKSANPWGVMVESATGNREYKFFKDQQARDYWVQLNGNVKAKLIGPEHFDRAASN